MAETMQAEVGAEGLLNSSILQNMLGSTQLLINHSDPTTYVSTRAERVALNMLKRFNSIFIKGRSGTGKSRLGLKLLSQIAKERKYTPLVMCFPQDWKLIPSTKEKYIVMIDDIFGSSNLAVSQEDKWKRQFEIMWPSVESGNILLVITSRPEISSQCKLRIQKYTLMERIPDIDLDEGELRLKPVEKMRFLKKYCGKRTQLNQEQMEEISKIHTSLGFPQCCEFFVKNKCVQTKSVRFFEKPHEFLNDVILSMKESDPVGYFVLQLVMLNQGSLEHEILKILHPSSEFRNLICELSSISYISSTPSRGQIKSKADSLSGVYLTNTDKTYKFAHQSIFDAVFLDFARECPEICIRNCPAHMLVELVRTEGQHTEKHEHDVVLQLAQDLHDVLADRFTELLQSPSATEIWDHPSLWNESFVHLLMSKLNSDNLGHIMSVESDSIHEFSYEKHLIDHQDILSYSIIKKNELLAKNMVIKLETTRHEYNKTATLALVVLKSLSGLVMSLINRGITPEKKCLQALCYSESLDDVVVETLLEDIDIPGYNIPHNEGIQLLAQASLNGNIAVAKMMMDVFVGRDKDNAYDCLDILFERMIGVELQEIMAHKIDSVIKLLLLNGIDEYELDMLVQICSSHLSALPLKAVLERDVMYDPSNWMFHLESALQYGVGELVEELLKKAVKEDMEEELSEFLYLAAGSFIDSGPKMNLLLRYFDNVISKVNETNGTLRTPPHTALKQGNTEVVKILVKEGVDFNLQDWTGKTLLLLAVMGGHEDLVKELLDAGADVNMRDFDSSDPVLLVTENINIMKMLVQAGSDVNDSNKLGRTALFTVVRENDLGAVRFLCTKGSDLTHADNEGRTVLHMACQFGDVDMIDFLCKKGAIPTSDNNGSSVLHYSVESESDAVENVQYAVDILGVPVDVEDSRGRTALFTAVQKPDMELVEYLLEKGADLKHRDKEDNSLLHAVCEWMRHFHFKMVKFLCDAGIDPDSCNKMKRTVLHVALSHRDTSLTPCIAFLTERMSDVNQADCDGTTPLHLAAAMHVYVELLLGLGARSNINESDHHGQTPLHLAAKSGSVICMRMLLENGADRSINQADNLGQTPLHLASTVRDGLLNVLMFGVDHYVGILLENGADKCINKTDSGGQSPLHLAAKCGNFQSVKLLLEKGADRNIKDKMGRRPADLVYTPQVRELLK